MTPVMENLYKDIIGHWPLPTLNDQDAADHIRQHVQDREAQSLEEKNDDWEVINFYINDLDMPRIGDFQLWDKGTQAHYQEAIAEAHFRALYGKQRD